MPTWGPRLGSCRLKHSCFVPNPQEKILRKVLIEMARRVTILAQRKLQIRAGDDFDFFARLNRVMDALSNKLKQPSD